MFFFKKTVDLFTYSGYKDYVVYEMNHLIK
jgi:hypothetical protein